MYNIIAERIFALNSIKDLGVGLEYSLQQWYTALNQRLSENDLVENLSQKAIRMEIGLDYYLTAEQIKVCLKLNNRLTEIHRAELVCLPRKNAKKAVSCTKVFDYFSSDPGVNPPPRFLTWPIFTHTRQKQPLLG